MSDPSDKEKELKPAFQKLKADRVPGEDLVAEGKALTKVDYGMFQAVQAIGDRDLAQFERNVVYEASEAGVECLYQWNQKGTLIKGGSIKLANIMVRCFGKCTLFTEIAKSDSRDWVFSTTFVDYETGMMRNRLFTQRKAIKLGEKMDDARKEDIAFQIGQSKSERNVILNCMPPSTVKKAMKAAEEASLGEIRKMGHEAALKRGTDFLEKYEISKVRIIAKFKKPFDEFLDTDLLELWTDCTAILDGHVTASGLYPPIDEAKKEKEKPKKASGKKPPKKDEGNEAPPKTDLFGKDKKEEPPEEPEPQPETETTEDPEGEEVDPDYELKMLLEEYDEDDVSRTLDFVCPGYEDSASKDEKLKAIKQCREVLEGLKG